MEGSSAWEWGKRDEIKKGRLEKTEKEYSKEEQYTELFSVIVYCCVSHTRFYECHGIFSGHPRCQERDD